MDHLHPVRRRPPPQQSSYQAQGSDGFGNLSSEAEAAAGQEAWLAHGAAGSPLDALMKGIVVPAAAAAAAAAATPGRSHIYNRAQALSRSTSVRRREEPQEQSSHAAAPSSSDEEQRREQVRRQRAARLSGQAYQVPLTTAAYEDDGPGPQRFTSTSNGAATPQPRDSTQLLSSSAFRNSVASDMSFNSLTGDSDRMSITGDSYVPNDGQTFEDDDEVARAVRGLHLRRRGSLDTVRSSEFGDEGRWGKAWADKAYDEESLYGGSEWGEESGTGENAETQGTLGSLAELARGNGLHLVDSPQQQQQQRSGNAGPSLHSVESSHHVVSLTPSSARGPALSSSSVSTSRIVSSPARRDTIRSVMADVDELDSPSTSEPDYATRRADRSSMASIASVSTIRGGGRGSSDGESSRDGAHVYVWPPTPAASVSSHGSDERGNATQGMLGAEATSARPRPDMQAWSAAVETMPPTTHDAQQQQQEQVKPRPPSQPQAQSRAPIGPSAVLARPLDSPILAPDGTRRTSGSRIAAVRGRGGTHGHPAGRAPPPTPPTEQAYAYADPNSASPAPLGRTRAQAIRNADGRESIVSDLDVETLRLDNSSRRGSTSTLASSRMSVGTVHYDHTQQQEPNRRESLESLYAKRTSSGSTINGFSMANGAGAGYAPSTRNGSFESTRQASAGSSIRSNEYAPRRAETQPTPPQSEAWATQEELHRSNTHPRQPSWESYPAQQQRSTSQPHQAGPASRPPPLEATYASASAASNASVRSLAQVVPEQPYTASSGPLRADTRTGPTAAEEFLSQGITYHESGDMARSAYYFERSARVEGGCVVGMCMWGMALREGWGARRDQKKGFEWISRAAARAGEMMSDGKAKSESELRSIRSELKLSVYELGKCFCYGWGVKMDKPMALEYFELAAKLGDVDSQAEAGALLAAGKGGCKKDLKKAAMYYRMAEAQGYELTGLSWVWKDKYNP